MTRRAHGNELAVALTNATPSQRKQIKRLGLNTRFTRSASDLAPWAKRALAQLLGLTTETG